eukprot:scaffold1255_cov120-Isochrysis_galbana.AAC.3
MPAWMPVFTCERVADAWRDSWQQMRRAPTPRGGVMNACFALVGVAPARARVSIDKPCRSPSGEERRLP